MAVYNEEFDNAGISASSPLYLYAGLHQFIYTPLLNGGKTLELKREAIGFAPTCVICR
jgi:hypothetical protein